MNKQEAKQKLHNIAFAKMNARPDDLKLADVMRVIDQIDQPQKVVVPKYIADKIEYCKNTEGYGLFLAMDYCYQYKDSATWLECNEETFGRAWLFGFEIEQEKLYTVEIPDPNVDEYSIVLGRKEGKVQIKQTFSTTWWMNCSNQLTESEIKKDFEWAWDAEFAKPVSEEVE